MKYIIGDLLEATEQFIMHGCNCQGVMGSGVAKAVKAKWPAAFDGYKQYCDAEPDKTILLGTNNYYMIDPNKVLINALTQVTFERNKAARYTAIIHCLDQLMADLELGILNVVLPDNTCNIAVPLIGAGLGGLKWDIVQELLEEYEETKQYDINVKFTVYKLP